MSQRYEMQRQRDRNEREWHHQFSQHSDGEYHQTHHQPEAEWASAAGDPGSGSIPGLAMVGTEFGGGIEGSAGLIDFLESFVFQPRITRRCWANTGHRPSRSVQHNQSEHAEQSN